MNLGGDLKDPRWMYTKAILFLIAGIAAGAGLLAEIPTLRTAFLLVVMAWSFCRLYYFLFYVIERYIDPAYRFDGIGSAVRYLLTRNQTTRRNNS